MENEKIEKRRRSKAIFFIPTFFSLHHHLCPSLFTYFLFVIIIFSQSSPVLFIHRIYAIIVEPKKVRDVENFSEQNEREKDFFPIFKQTKSVYLLYLYLYLYPLMQ